MEDLGEGFCPEVEENSPMQYKTLGFLDCLIKAIFLIVGLIRLHMQAEHFWRKYTFRISVNL